MRQLRAEARLTQEELAEAAGLSPRTISDLERGLSRTARPDTAGMLADAIGLAEPVRAVFIRAARGRAAVAEVLAARAGHAAPAGTLAVSADLRRPTAPVPRELPADVRAFTGRETELAALDCLLLGGTDDGPGRRRGPVAISALGGTAGVGKTALAVHWAHQAASGFPDGQLYVNLHGYDPDPPPVPAADALAGFLRALGVAVEDIPPGADERAARYRSLLAGRRVLVILDNAGSEEQVRPLLPATPSCATVVTSRDALAGLVARDGATRLDLDLLPQAEAITLLRTLIGARADADPEAAATLAAQCCRLPLALRVAAELAAARPGDRLADLVAELADQRQRLDLLAVGDDSRTALRAVFSWSYRHLDTAAARAFRLVGLHPGPDLDSYAAAALTGTTLARAGQLLDRLARAHLIHAAEPGRYGMHDLLRAYARELASRREGTAAMSRLLNYYLHAASAATDTLYPIGQPRQPSIPALATPIPPVTDQAAAQAWLDGSRICLVAAAAHAASQQWPGHAIRLAATLRQHLVRGAHYAEAITIHTCSASAARRIGDRVAEAESLTRLGVIYWYQGQYSQAGRCQQQALDLCRQCEDQSSEAYALGNLGIINFRLGRYEQAIRQLRESLDLFRRTGNQVAEGHTLISLGEVGWRHGKYRQAARHLQLALHLCRQGDDRNGEGCALILLGLVYGCQGRYEEAAACQQQALTVFRQVGSPAGEADALTNLGEIDLRQGRYQHATRHLRHALGVFRRIGGRPGEADALTQLGDVCLRQGRYRQAIHYQQQAVDLYRQVGDEFGTAQALNGLGEALQATGQVSRARIQHVSALTLSSQTRNKHQQARALDNLGHLCQLTGHPDQARRHWQQALTLYTALGAPEASQVRTSLRL